MSATEERPLRRRARAILRGPETKAEDGSLILDILIGMAIFALIAIIAVSAISQYRERAYEQGAVSDAKSVGLALEAAYTDTQSYPADAAAVAALFASAASNGTMTKGITVADYVTGGGKFAFCVEHESGGTPDAWAVYNSAKGGIAGSGRGESCAEAMASTPELFVVSADVAPPAEPPAPAVACPSGTMTISSSGDNWWVAFDLSLPAEASGMKYVTSSGYAGGGNGTGAHATPNTDPSVPGASDTIKIDATVGSKPAVTLTDCAPVAYTWPATFGDTTVVTIP